MSDRETLNDRPKEQRRGGLLMLFGMLLSLTIIGSIVGVPMIILGYWYWKQGEQAAAEDTDAPPGSDDATA